MAIGGSQTVLLGHTALLFVVPVVGADGHCVVQMARRQVVGGPALQQTKRTAGGGVLARQVGTF